MPQGKFKKTKVPDAIKKKQQKKISANGGKAFTRRQNAPIQQKKLKFTEQQKLKNVVSKAVNKTSEEELRSRAAQSKLNLSKAQETVAKYNNKNQPKNSIKNE